MKQIFDLHCHSHYSDGLLSPNELMTYAAEREINTLALTDHDSVSGLPLAADAITEHELPLSLINGIEISAMTSHGEVHVVGLGIDIYDTHLNAALKIQRDKRWRRAEHICLQLEKAGVVGVLEETQSLVVEIVTRTHLAKAIVSLGHAKDMKQAFKRYIGKGGRIKVNKDWMSLACAIDLITGAGGIPVLAHPTRYPLSNRRLTKLIGEFAGEGGEAIEGAYPGTNREQMAWLKARALDAGLILSSGSDFHYPNLKWSDLGKFPATDSTVAHVLDRLN